MPDLRMIPRARKGEVDTAARKNLGLQRVSLNRITYIMANRAFPFVAYIGESAEYLLKVGGVKHGRVLAPAVLLFTE